MTVRMTALPNLGDYDQARKTFTWEAAGEALTGLPGRAGLNIAYEAVDRHVAEGRGETAALRWIAAARKRSSSATPSSPRKVPASAMVLAKLGIEPGDRVFTLLNRVPALYVSALGIWKRGAVFSPLFSAFGPGADQGAYGDRRAEGSRDDGAVLRTQGEAGAR